MQTSLPIWQIHEPIVKAMRDGNRLVLVAPTGSGKTTQVPQMLLDSGLFQGRIVVLQPRRVAARTVAARVAWERHVNLGAEVGYQIRFEDRTSLGTRICYITEGILLRWLQDDSDLRGIDAVLFDEFHERNLLSDVALALVRRLQETRRAELRLIVMSATLEAEPVAKYLGDCPVLISEGKAFPVDIRHIAMNDERPVSDQAADIVAQIVRSGDPGDILIFMPGMGEINSTINATRAAAGSERLALIPLHGELPPEEQDLAFAPNPRRKVVVATNVAETSVTIDGIIHVIDSGQARIARYDPERGIGTLFIEPISRASADQRAGRAGRTAPGVCHRLWTESGHLNRPERNTPEIQRSDLAEVVLLLHSFGIRDAAHFDWLDRPDPQAVERAEQLLRTLGALRSSPSADERSDMTPVGWEMLRLPMHPRYSRMLVEAARRNCVPAAALCAALVSGRDLLVRLGRDDKHIAEARELFEASAESDFYTLLRAHQFARNNHFSPEQCRRYGVHAQIARQVQQTFEQILQVAGCEKNAPAPADDALARCLTAGFIDQLCRRRDQGTLDCDVAGGRTGTLVRESVVQTAPLFVAASIREVMGRTGNMTLLGLATAVKREWIQEMFPDQISITTEHLFDRTHKRVSAVKLERFHDLLLHHEHQREVDPAASGLCLAEAYAREYFELPLFNHELKQTIARINLVCAVMPELDLTPADRPYVTGFLARAFAGLTLAKEAQATPLLDLFVQHYGKDRIEWLSELAPVIVTWPDGRKLKLLYPEETRDDDGEPNSPELQAKLHECFGLKEHPHICEGKLPVKLWLATPDGKRIDSTFNWPAFKTNTYPRLKPALQKKFPAFLWV
ncbi:MAG TPA: ATP-dependent helicase HrpB [Verrucomicrobiae bacterium]|nr:ATP-dependent helicase HrpB [Verrucomicrobiae bacterium]